MTTELHLFSQKAVEPVFVDDIDYRNFATLLRESLPQAGVELFGWCLLPAAIHLLVRGEQPDKLRRWSQRLMTTHAKRHHARYGTRGPLWKGRPRIIPVQSDEMAMLLLVSLRQLPRRLRLCPHQGEWRWIQTCLEIAEVPVSLHCKLRFVEHCLVNGIPVGDTYWLSDRGAELIGWQPPKPRGRPRREREGSDDIQRNSASEVNFSDGEACHPFG